MIDSTARDPIFEQHKASRWQFKLLTVLLFFSSILLSVFIGEKIVESAWLNPYEISWKNFSGYNKFATPHKISRFNVSGLYLGAESASLRTGEFGEILGPPEREKPRLFVFGGSTSKCEFIDEKKRWPDLIDKFAVTNFAESGNALGDTFFNLKFILENYPQKPDSILIMHAVNDFNMHRVFNFSSIEKGMTEWSKRRWGERTSLRIPRDKLAEKYSLYALMKGFWKTVKTLTDQQTQKTVLEGYVVSKERNQKGAFVSDSEFALYLEKEFPVFEKNRAAVFSHIRDLVEKHSIQGILMTQPHAYRKKYRPLTDIDLREYPHQNGRNFTLEQAAEIFSRTNSHTRKIAKDFGWKLLDLEAHFSQKEIEPLLYDSVHYSEKGAADIARFINSSIGQRHGSDF